MEAFNKYDKLHISITCIDIVILLSFISLWIRNNKNFLNHIARAQLKLRLNVIYIYTHIYIYIKSKYIYKLQINSN